MPLDDLLAAIRGACPPSRWARGVELARAGAVHPEASDDGLAARVATRGGLVAPLARLFEDDGTWDCECDARDEACEHVAAAVIALTSGAPADDAGAAPAAARIRYVVTSGASGLELAREAWDGVRGEPILAALAAIAGGRADGPRFLATPVDRAVDAALGTHRRGTLPREAVPRVLAALAGGADIVFEGRAVRAAAAPVGLIARVVDAGDGFRLSVVPDPSITQLFANRAALCGEVLRPVADDPLTAREREELPRGRLFARTEVARLVGEVLPSLAKRLPLSIESPRLPGAARVAPRLLLEARDEGKALTVAPWIVYGDPPLARVENDRLVPLGPGAIPVRDPAAERRLAAELARDTGLSAGAAVTLDAVQAIECARRATLAGLARGAPWRAFRREADLDVTAGNAAEGYVPRFTARGLSARAADVVAAWRAGEPLVRLEQGGFAPLPAQFLARAGHLVEALLDARAARRAAPALAAADAARLAHELGVPPPPDAARLRALVDGFDALPEPALPDGFALALRPYQRDGVAWLGFLREAGLGALLADDMGLGKTVQALAALHPPALVVCPTSVLGHWKREAERARPGLRACVYHGTGRQLDPTAELVVTTYALLRQDAAVLGARPWETVVLDEAQAIKNDASQTARAAFALPARWRIAMTGTPVENRLDELWSQMHFLEPALLGPRAGFVERYARPIAGGDASAAAQLARRIRPLVLRRHKSAVERDLPELTEVTLACELGDAERALYDAVRAAARADVAAALGRGDVLAALERLLRLRQAACHPALVPGGAAPTSSKLELLLETLEESLAAGHKVLVFSQWTSLLDLVEPHLAQRAVGFTRLDGSTRDRQAVIDGFSTADGPPVMLLSLMAGGTGLNLTAADHVVLLDPWWNPAVEDQAAARVHRIGQTRPVIVYRLVAADTVEERMLELAARKRALSEAVLDGAAAAARLTRDDLLALLD